WECYCGKYKRVRFKGIICERCGVEVTRSKVRRERMGHIELAAPVVHIWYLRGTRSWLAYLLMGTEVREELKAKQLEKVIYFAANLVTWVDEAKRDADLPNLEAEVAQEREAIEKERELELARRMEELEAELKGLETEGAKDSDLKARQKQADKDLALIRERYELELDVLQRAFDEFKSLFARQIIEDEMLWRELADRYGEYFEGGMGADAIKQLIDRLDLDVEEVKLRNAIDPQEGQRPLSAQRKQKAIKRLKIVASFNQRDEHGKRVNDPRAMILDVVPVIPPELRPMVQLDGGRFATSDLNDLYRRVINRNNRLKRLLDLGAPEIIVNNEKRMLQEAVDALFDNGRRGRPVTGPGNRPLKSLSDMLKGKQGRFRQNLLGKRVDYSGRSVIVVGPTLKLHQCGLPKLMALELFKPFVMKKLVDAELAQNIKSAKRMVERRKSQVWDVLEEAIKEHPVLLNRAPTLHRLGIQAFEPVLVEGKAIQIHPLVCTAFNADFDGDQMAVHLPLSSEAQAESRVLMLSANNVLSPAHGRPLVTPTQDMIIGAFYLTESVQGAKGEGRVFRHLHEIERAYENGDLALHALIKFRGYNADGSTLTLETTAGRLFFNQTLPEGFERVESRVDKKVMGNIVDVLASEYPKGVVANSLDAIKNLCFRYAAKSGITISVEDVKTPPEKAGILEDHEEQAQKVETQFRRGIITDGERRQKEVEIWTDATDQVRAAMEKALKEEQFNPIEMMVGSGARGNMMQVRQIAGMRGLVANPRGDMIPRPIKSNFREGLEMLEYFIATPGARKGLVDTALRTADSGYLTRRLVDVAQELIINDEDPFVRAEVTGAPIRGMYIEDVWPDGFFSEDGKYVGPAPKSPTDKVRRTYLETKLYSRTLANDVKCSDGTVFARGTVVDQPIMEKLRDDPDVDRVRVLSPLTDDSAAGISGASYGMSLATGKAIEVGEAVGVIAAQSIGEPGTQLTMRTFHTGGVAGGGDIAGGLPRVVELFEARSPKGKATLARTSGVVRVGEDEGKGRVITIIGEDGTEDAYTVPGIARLEVTDGADVEAGDPIVEGPRDPKELLEIRGVRETQQYLVEQVQKVYREQGVSIHDKHIELIVRQMTRRVIVLEPNESEFLPGERVDQKVFADTNKLLVEEGKKPAEGRVELMGITKASLATDSWLSAASFQETTRVLTEAAIDSRSDSLMGLKENIIIGKLIPAGTGMQVYRDIDTRAPDYQPMAYYSSDDNEVDPAEWLANLGASDGSGHGNGADVIGLPAEGAAER
ncbi:MAG: DNA-directed polymerase, beta subunit, partial [Acidimicrobiales bacterium]|nr:DNA-directed polymerase, beta subunit [Acidimicrobiales bacterium]